MTQYPLGQHARIRRRSSVAEQPLQYAIWTKDVDGQYGWRASDDEFYEPAEVDEIRLCAVIEVEEAEETVLVLRGAAKTATPGLAKKTLTRLADAVETTMRAPRIEEPGLYGVVTATRTTEWRSGGYRFTFVRYEGGWFREGDRKKYKWDDILDPEVARPGIEPNE